MKIQIALCLLAASLALHAQPLSLEISRNPPANIFLDLYGLQTGGTYGVGAKPMPTSDPFDVWGLIGTFDAPAPAVRFDLPATLPQRTFIAVNLNNYDGPSVRILSPAAGSIASGDVPVQVLVTDILPLEKVEVFVGEILAGIILAGQGGAMSLPSYWFPNGEQEIWVRVVNQGIEVDTDGDTVPDSPATFDGWGSVSVTFSNDLYMTSYSPLYSSFGSITMDYFAATPHDWTFEVFRENGELLHTQSGVSIDGDINPQWNFTDLDGNYVGVDEYVFSLTATPLGALPSPPPPPPPGGSTNSPPPPPPPGGQQSFQGSGDSELRLVESGTVLSSIYAPQPNLTAVDLADILAKIAAMEPSEPPPLPPSPPWPPKLPSNMTMTMTTTAAGSKNIKTTNIFDAGVTVAKYVISYGEHPQQELNDLFWEMNASVSYRANTAAFSDPDIIGENREAHGIIRADFSSEPYAIKQATQTNDMAFLTNALADHLTGSWLFQGHSSSSLIIAGRDGYLTVQFTAQQLAALLGNTFKMSGPYMKPKSYSRRYFSTMITGCSAANGYWAVVVGTPPGVKQQGNARIKKSAYLAFKRVSFPGQQKINWIKAIHVVWIDWNIYDTPLEAAVDAANTQYPQVTDWKPVITGYRPLAYDGVDSR